MEESGVNMSKESIEEEIRKLKDDLWYAEREECYQTKQKNEYDKKLSVINEKIFVLDTLRTREKLTRAYVNSIKIALSNAKNEVRKVIDVKNVTVQIQSAEASYKEAYKSVNDTTPKKFASAIETINGINSSINSFMQNKFSKSEKSIENLNQTIVSQMEDTKQKLDKEKEEKAKYDKLRDNVVENLNYIERQIRDIKNKISQKEYELTYYA